MGLLSGLFGGGGPSRQVIDLDKDTKGLINENIDKTLSRDTQSYRDEAMSGVPEAFQATQQTPQQVVAESAGFGSSPFMGDAIRGKYQQEANQDLNKFKMQSDLKASGERQHQLNRSFNFAMAAQNVQIQNMQRLAEANMQATMMRAQVIGDVLSAGGKLAGAYMANKQPSQQKPDYTGGWNTPQPRNPNDMMNNQNDTMVG